MATKLNGMITMKMTNIAELKNDLSKILAFVEKGEKVQICRRNVPIAYIVPYKKKTPKNKTVLGCGKGTVRINCDLTEPMIPNENWEMLQT